MNSMELVRRQFTSANPRRSSETRSAPRFCAELAGPVRGAILRARQCLIAEQRNDGLWCGRQSTDASLASLCIFWLAVCEREQSELGQQCAAKIIEQQTATGGWSRMPNGADDVSVSVQAYFALKLASISPTSERLVRARNAIRQLGGADVADAETRLILALFGQIKYDYCAGESGERLLFESECSQLSSLATVRARRPVRDVGLERGVRELFVMRPGDWPRLSNPRSPYVREAELKPLDELRFDELIWHLIALHATGAHDNSEMQACEDRLHDLIIVDEDDKIASPQYDRDLLADTALVVPSLVASGVSVKHGTVREAVDAMGELAIAEQQPLSTMRTCAFLNAWTSAIGLDENTEGLPPGLEVIGDWPQFSQESASDSEQVVAKSTVEFAERLLRRQNSDGGWSDRRVAPFEQCSSAPDITAAALESLAGVKHSDLHSARDYATGFLQESQKGDGSWVGASGVEQVRATSAAIRGLLSAGVPPDHEAIAAGINWLFVHQHRDGGWQEGTKDSTASPTAWAVLSLVAAGKASHAACRRGVQFLIESQGDDGRWNEPEFAPYNPAANRWIGNKLHSVAWPLLALSRWAVAAISAQSAATDEMSLRLVGVSAVE
jgi:squalene-hopene/tetraprenyl-beta-curcumene cyclase